MHIFAQRTTPYVFEQGLAPFECRSEIRVTRCYSPPNWPPSPGAQRRKWRDFATSADYHQRRAAAHHAAFTWSGWRGARPIVEALQSCKRTAYPRSGKRVRNAEIATSPARTRLPVPRRRPARLPLLALGCVGHSTTSALAKPAHTRRAWRLGTRQNHRRWLVGGEGRSG